MNRLSDVTNQAIQNLLGYRNVTKGTLAINVGGAATIKNTGAINYVNNGVLLQKAALAAQSIVPTVGLSYSLPAGKTCYFSIGYDGSGNVSVTQGSYAGQTLNGNPAVGIGISQLGATWVGDGTIPDLPAGVTPIGVIKIVNVTNPFIAGTTALDAAGVTATYFDVATLPVGVL